MKLDLESKMKCYWPEIHRYCGCCSLRTGIYIRTVFSMIINLINLGSNCLVLFYMIQASTYLFESDEDYTSKERIQKPDISELTQERAILVYKILFGYYVAWIVFKVAYAFLLFVMIYGVFAKKSKILRIYLYIVVPYWIFDVIISSLVAIVSSFWLKALFVIALLSEGYNLLAISTEYKVLTGKSMLAQDSPSVDVESITDYGNDSVNSTVINDTCDTNNPPHCSTCTCHMNSSSESNRAEDIPTSSNSENENASSIERPKKLNFKEEPVIYDQDQMIDLNSPVLTECRNPTLESCSAAEKDKHMDEPIIYDDSQLNVGTSPIIENRPFIEANQNEANR